MHLHDLLRTWRDEIVSKAPRVALAEDEVKLLRADQLVDRERMTVPGKLRRDEREPVQATLFPARHEPNKPASDDALDDLEAALDFTLPRPLELFLRLHDGGAFFMPDVADLPEAVGRPLRILSCAEMAEAYDELVMGVRAQLAELEPDDDDLVRIAGRFGCRGDGREAMVGELEAINEGAEAGLQLIPLVRAPGTRNYVVYAPHAGREGRVGYAFADAGYLPEDSMEFAFEGMEGWLKAILDSRACKRIVLT